MDIGEVEVCQVGEVYNLGELDKVLKDVAPGTFEDNHQTHSFGREKVAWNIEENRWCRLVENILIRNKSIILFIYDIISLPLFLCHLANLICRQTGRLSCIIVCQQH